MNRVRISFCAPLIPIIQLMSRCSIQSSPTPGLSCVQSAHNSTDNHILIHHALSGFNPLLDDVPSSMTTCRPPRPALSSPRDLIIMSQGVSRGRGGPSKQLTEKHESYRP